MVAVGTVRCPSCGAGSAAGARFCSNCATELGAAALRSADPVERKQVTVLFSDLTGYTALSERLDPEETREIVGRVFGQAAEIVARYEGRIEKFIGDAIMAIFGVPIAHEDDPARAVRAALELHAAVGSLSPQVQARVGTAIALHSGINTGLVVTGELHYGDGTAGPLGDTINVAARLMNAAPSGEIWIGAETRVLVSQAFDLDDIGVRDFKGKTNPIAVSRVRGVKSRAASVRQFRGNFVGRQAELGALLGAAERMRDGAAAVFGICGGAGTGKSRLVAEFRARVGPDVRWLEGRAYPYSQNTPYAPIIDLLSRSWAIEEGDSPGAVCGKLEAGIANLAVEAEAVLPLLLHLYDLPQREGVVIEREAFQDRLLHASRLLIAALAQRTPTVICLQDLHWADSSTTILVSGLCEDLNVPVLLVVNFRPGFVPPPAMAILELRDLSRRQTTELLASLLNGKPPNQLTRFIEDRSDGNPFYVEEVVNSLVETAVLTRGAQGWELTRPLAEAGVPATVTGVIAARIDRLDESARRVLRHAAVVGREFLYTIIARVTEGGIELRPSLDMLQEADLIRMRRPAPELEYIFKHALTQEVAYDGLLKSERKRLHQRTAVAIENLLGDRVGEFVETLAYHYSRGGVTDKAVGYLIEAGRKCVARYALLDAGIHFREAYGLIGDLERSAVQAHDLVELLVSWSQVHYYEGSVGTWRRLLEKHLVDAERCDDQPLLAMYLSWLGLVRGFHGDIRGSAEALDRAVHVAHSVNARDALAYALAWQTFTLFEVGRVEDAIRVGHSLQPGAGELLRNPYPFAFGRCGLVIALIVSGDLRRAREIAHEVIAGARISGNARAESHGHFVLAYQELIALDFDRAAATAQAGMDAAKDPFFASQNADVRAVALASAMRLDEASRLCDAWLPTFVEYENVWFGSAMSSVRASIDLASGRLAYGMRGMLAEIAASQRRGYVANSSLGEIFLLMTYVSIVRRDVKPPLGAILRNLWFVLAQAPFAARKARKLIERLRNELEQQNMRGFLGLVDLCEGRLLAHQRKQAQAREVVARIRRRLLDVGVQDTPAPVADLEAEIAR